MRLPRSPIVRFAFVGCLAGAAIGLYFVLVPMHRAPDPTLQRDGKVVHETIEIESRQWRVKKVPDEAQPVGFRYEVEETAEKVPYIVSRTVNGNGTVEDGEAALWQRIVSVHLVRGNFEDAIAFVATLRDDGEKSRALERLISTIQERHVPYQSEYRHYGPPSLMPVPAPALPPAAHESDRSASSAAKAESTQRKDINRQNELRAFVATIRGEATRALEIARTIDQATYKARVLLKISDVQDRIDDVDEATKTLDEAMIAFQEHQREEYGRWARIIAGIGTIWKWVAGMGLFTLLAGYFSKVVGHYFIEALARKVGDENFAKALGTTLKTTVKQSGLILPERFKD